MKPMPLAQMPIPLTVFWILLAILIASGAIFWMLLRRWTTQQQWLALSDWAESNGFQLRGEARAIMPDALKFLGEEPPRVLVSLHDPDTAIVQIETLERSATQVQRSRWNLLIRNLATPWPITCLRPTVHAKSLLEFLPLGTMRAMVPGERFILYGQQNIATRALNQSAIRALLPPDVGLALAGENLLLDFSTRPFDPIELQRIDALAEQIVAHLPQVQLSQE